MENTKPNNATVRKATVKSYSERGANVYDDPMNMNFLYGDITLKFLKQIEFKTGDNVVLDMGCGTGFAFSVLNETFESNNIVGIGVEPAKGMLEIAEDKYKDDKKYTFHEGSFEKIPVENGSVDKIISTLALHWVKSIEIAASEMRRVLKRSGSLDILMIAKDDGHNFKRAIVETMKKHLTFEQIMRTATLVQRVKIEKLNEIFAETFKGFNVNVTKFNDVVYGSFDDHMKWWKARSSPVIEEVKDKELFVNDLRIELGNISDEKGIPFDLGYFWIRAKG